MLMTPLHQLLVKVAMMMITVGQKYKRTKNDTDESDTLATLLSCTKQYYS